MCLCAPKPSNAGCRSEGQTLCVCALTRADIGVFNGAVIGLTPGEAYSFAAYAANSVGTGYSATDSFISIPFTYTSTAGSVTITGYNGGDVAVTIPATIGGQPVTKIGDGAFALTNSRMTSITLPDSVTSIGYSAFWQCEALTSINIPSGVTSIGAMAFADCPSLTSITIPSGVASIEYNTFSGCQSLTNVTIPSSVTSIEEGAFAGCTGLQSITIPSSVTSIGNQAFAGCSGLTSITIPNGTSIGDSVFSSCTGLTSITIPSGVTGIGALMFCGCTGLTSITIPSSVTSIGDTAFANCTGLTSAIFLGNAPELGGDVFYDTDPGFTVYYQSGAKDFTSPTWNDYPAESTGSSDPAIKWLSDNKLPTTADLASAPNGDGVSLLMAYALNLDPNQNQSGSMPKPVIAGNQMGMAYYAGSTGVTYSVETSSDLKTWTTSGVTLSAPDANHIRTATVPTTGSNRFMRLVVGY